MRIILSFLFFLFTATACVAQTTAFTYQGKLSENGAAVNGACDIEFRLFDVASGGAAIATQQKLNVQVTDGVFAVELDYGPAAFAGSARYIELAVKPSGGGSFTTMSPRSPINSAPYSIKSLNAENAVNATNATQLGGVNASSFVQSNDSRMSDARMPLPGSGSYVQNGDVAQANSSFNVTGNGTVGGTLAATVVKAGTQYDIGGNRVMSNAGIANMFVGELTGTANTTGKYNSFVGALAGQVNTTGINNTFVGASAGAANTDSNANSFFGYLAGSSTQTDNNSFFGAYSGKDNVLGYDNAFFGFSAGRSTTTGHHNSFFGRDAGRQNTIGASNSFFGFQSGFFNVNGVNNSFFGYNSGISNVSGNFNSFVGFFAGNGNTSGEYNTFFGTYAGSANDTGKNLTMIGAEADVATDGLQNATALGYRAAVSQSNSIVLGGIAGVNAGTNTSVGIGTTAPKSRLHIVDNSGNIHFGNAGCNAGFAGLGFASTLTCTNYSLLGEGTNTILNRPTGGAIHFRENNVLQVSINPGGTLSINTLGSAGSTQLCRNASNQISTCSSSLRYKKDLQPFTGGLAVVARLNPITFRWKADNTLDLGFGAEDVAKVEPLLTIRNEKGEIEGVKYDRISAVLVNAVKEQQSEITSLRTQVSEQMVLIEALKKLVCQNNPQAAVCK